MTMQTESLQQPIKESLPWWNKQVYSLDKNVSDLFIHCRTSKNKDCSIQFRLNMSVQISTDLVIIKHLVTTVFNHWYQFVTVVTSE